MRRAVVVLVGLVALAGCFGPYDDPYQTSDGTKSYLSTSDYTVLLDALELRTNINRSVIDQELSGLNVRTTYEYSYYDSGSYVAHTMNWNAWSSVTYDFIYYVSVDIWLDESGNLRRSMCSYYSG